MKWLLIINLNGEKSLHMKWPLTKRIMEKNEFCSLKFWVKALHFFFFAAKEIFPCQLVQLRISSHLLLVMNVLYKF